VHLKTSNPIESTFATVRLRTKVTKGPGSRAAGLAMVFKLLEVSFFTEVLTVLATQGRLGGRGAVGHGLVRADLTRTVRAGTGDAGGDWRTQLDTHRPAALSALQALT
jgi:hypothetical protein